MPDAEQARTPAGNRGPTANWSNLTSPMIAALEYAKQGWLSIPVTGKEPLTKHGVKDGTTDEATIRGWWDRWPNANVAIITGAASGIVVLDVDPRNGGDRSLLRFRFPDTLQVRTGGGGQHFYFAHPGGTVRCRVVAPGLDLKGDGGYVVAPPSIHPSGQEYRWVIPDD